MVLRLWSASPVVRCCWCSSSMVGGYAIALCVACTAPGLGRRHLAWSDVSAEAHTARCYLSLELGT